MNRLFKKIAVAFVAIAAVCACAFVAACSKDNSSSSSEDTSAKYNITVLLPDGSPLNGTNGSKNGGKVAAQLCNSTTCFLNPTVDANGKCTITQKEIDKANKSSETTFTFHVKNVAGCEEDCNMQVSAPGEYTLTLTAADPLEGATWKIKLTKGGSPLADAQVTITANDTSKNMPTDANGELSLTYDMLKGQFGKAASFTVSVAGHTLDKSTLDEANKNTTVNVVATAA